MKKNDILIAAIIEFGEKGYDRASINTIIEKSNTSKGTFYHYFNSKEALYLELVKKIAEEKIEYFKENSHIYKVNKNESTVFEMLKSHIRAAMDFALKYPQYADFSIRLASETNLKIKEKIRAVVANTSNDYLNQLIKIDKNNPIIRNDLPDEVTSGLLTFMLTHFTDFLSSMGISINTSNSKSIEAHLEYYIRFLESGLRKN